MQWPIGGRDRRDGTAAGAVKTAEAIETVVVMITTVALTVKTAAMMVNAAATLRMAAMAEAT
jgi:hypothetical protein